MKYMILTYGSQQDYDGTAGQATDQSAWSPEDFAAMAAFMTAFNTELAETGELVETRALAAPVHARRLGAQNGVPFVTRRPVRRDPGGARRLLDRGVRQLRSSHRDRRPAGGVPGTGTGEGQRLRRRATDHGIRRRNPGVYLIFTEGYAATTGPRLHRVELSTEAIRLARMVYKALPDDGEVVGLLALMLLTDARRAAWTTAEGELVPLAEQDCTLWDADDIA